MLINLVLIKAYILLLKLKIIIALLIVKTIIRLSFYQNNLYGRVFTFELF